MVRSLLPGRLPRWLVALLAVAVTGTAMPVRATVDAATPVADPSLPGEILVRLARADALSALLEAHRLTELGRFGARPIFRLGTADGADLEATVEALKLDPAVLDAEPNFLHAAPEARKNNAWAIGTPSAYTAQWMPGAIRLAAAQRLSVGEGVRVAVLDTGIDAAHPALLGRVLPGFDFVDGDVDPAEGGSPANAAFGHGTHVAGLVLLVAPAARVVPYRVLDADGRTHAWVLGEAMLRAVDPDGDAATDDGAHVLNLSLGSLSRTHLMDVITRLASCALLDAEDPTVAEGFADPGYDDDKARCRVSRGAVIVAAAGNDASRSAKEYPAAEGAYGLVAVAASAADGGLAAFSNAGSWIDIAAPGDGITSTVPGAAYGTWSGTSMAAPVVAGAVALLRAFDRTLSPDAVAKRLKHSGGALCGASQRQVDAEALLTAAPAPAAVCR